MATLSTPATRTPNRIENLYPLTPLQNGMLYTWIAGGAHRHYFELIRLDFAERLDAETLRQAFQQVVDGHEVLRGVVRHGELREPALVVMARRTARVEHVELTAAPGRTVEQSLADYETGLFECGFDLTRDLLVRLHLLHTGADSCRLLVAFHHIILDGESGGLFVNELLARYDALVRGAALPVEPNRGYGDHVRRLAAARVSTEAAADRLAVRLAELTAPTPFPVHGRPDDGRYEHAELAFALDEALSVGIDRLAAASGVTPNAVFQAAWSALLSRYCSAERTAHGIVVNNRPAEGDAARALGLFINTLPLVLETGPERPFTDLLRDAGVAVGQLVDGGTVGLAELQRRSALRRNLIDHVVLFENFALDRGAVNSASGTTLFHGRRLSGVSMTEETEYDFSLSIHPGTPYQLRMIFNAAAVPSAFAARCRAHLVSVLSQVVTDPGVLLGDLTILDAAERRRLEVDFQPLPTEFDWSADVPAMIRARAAATPDALAVVTADARLTYAELLARAESMAALLQERGVMPGDRVAVLLPRSLDLLPGLLATHLAGAAYVPLDPEYPAERIAAIVADSGARVGLAPEGTTMVGLDTVSPAAARPGATPRPVPGDPDRVAYLIYTSGSTGRPKGVSITHRNLKNFVEGIEAAVSLADCATFLAITTVSFDIFVLESWLPLARGRTVVLVDEEEASTPDLLAARLRRDRVDVVQLTPSRARLLLETSGAAALAGVRRILVGGEAFPEQLREPLTAIAGAEVHNVYGPTETTVWSTTARVLPGTPIDIGRPIANTTAHILDTGGRLLPLGITGELCLGGLGVSPGYHGLNELTAERFVTLPGLGRVYRTGDLARWTDDGRLECFGRGDHQVKVRGYRIELTEIEQALERLPQVSAAAVWTVAEPGGDNSLRAAYVASTPLTEGELVSHLAGILPTYMIPATFTALDALPQTPNGKLDRRAVAALVPEATVGAEPETETERRVHDLWCEVLHRDRIGVEENFYAAGGQSVYLIQIIARIAKAFDRDVGVREFMECGTIRRLAARLDDGATTTRYPRVEPEPGRRGEPFPMTGIQNAYLVGRSGGPGLGGLGTQVYTELEGPLSVPDLERALNELVARHPMLRTVFGPDGTQRELLEVPPFRIARIDASGLDEAAAAAACAQVRERLTGSAAAADRWPLFDVAAVTLPGGDVRLCCRVDMLIADATSMRILLAEIGQLMDASAELPPAPRLTFQDYQRAMTQLRSTPLYAADRAWWRSRVPQLPPAPALPLVADPATVAEPTFRRLAATLGDVEWAALKGVAAEWRISPSALVLTAYTDVLARWNNQPQMSINLTLFNRLPVHAEVDRIVGDFTSVLLVDADAAAGPTFRERCAATQARLNDALDHRHYDGVDVIRDYATHHGSVGEATMPVVFTSVLTEEGPVPATSLRPGYSITQTSQVYLDNQAGVHDGRLSLNWDYVVELFDPEVVGDMFTAYVGVLRAVAAGAEPDLGFLPAGDDRALAYNRTDAPIPRRTLTGLVADQVARTPDAPAVLHGDRVLTYAELDAWANRVAHALRACGVAPGDAVGVLAVRRPESVVALLGVLRAGAWYVPVDPSHPAERREYMLTNAGARLCIGADEAFWATVDAQPTTDPGVPVAECDLAYTIYTSGSTGRPKGVAIRHEAAANTVQNVNERFAVGPQDRIIGLSSLCFDLSVYDVFGALSTGAALCLIDDQRDAGLIDACLRTGVTFWNSVPAILQMYLDTLAPGEQLPGLRSILLSGDWIPVTLPALIREHCPAATLYSLGGATEGSIWSIWYPVGELDPAWTSIPYGYPMANQSMWVLDHADRVCRVGTTGEICIGGLGVAEGYCNDPEKTAAAFIEHPRLGRLYRTGDYGRYVADPAGLRIELVGRRDHQVKIRGYRVELAEIEKALGANEFVERALISFTTDQRGRRALVAYFTAHDDITAPELRGFLARSLPEYMIPDHFVELDAFPLTPNGKVDHRALPQPEVATDEPAEPPVGEVEERIARIWADELGVASVGRGTSYFDLGGSSLDASRIVHRVEREFGVPVPLAEILTNPTVAGVGDHVSGALASVLPSAPGAQLMNEYAPGRENLFLVHAGSGEVTAYAQIAAELADEYNVWALAARPLSTRAPVDVTVEEIAAGHVASIRAVQPGGPYRVGGWCVGGTFAFGCAAQLEAEGEEVVRLYLLNSYAPQSGFYGERTRVSLAEEQELATTISTEFDLGIGERIAGADSIEQVWTETLAAIDDPEDAGIRRFVLDSLPAEISPIIPLAESQPLDRILYYVHMIKTLAYARARYVPQRALRANVTFVGARDSAIVNRAEWSRFVEGEPDWVEVEAEHFTLLQEPAVHLVGRAIRKG